MRDASTRRVNVAGANGHKERGSNGVVNVRCVAGAGPKNLAGKRNKNRNLGRGGGRMEDKKVKKKGGRVVGQRPANHGRTGRL